MLFGMEHIEAIAQSLIFWGFVLVLILGLAIGPRYLRSRDRQRLYEVMRIAYEKGQPVPPELVASLTRSEAEDQTAPRAGGSGPDRDLRRAVVLIAVGMGLAALGFGLGYGISFASNVGGAITGGIIAGAGAIPGFIGVAYLILWLTSGRGRRSY
jgi:hypothetical protein